MNRVPMVPRSWPVTCRERSTWSIGRKHPRFVSDVDHRVQPAFHRVSPPPPLVRAALPNPAAGPAHAAGRRRRAVGGALGALPRSGGRDGRPRGPARAAVRHLPARRDFACPPLPPAAGPRRGGLGRGLLRQHRVRPRDGRGIARPRALLEFLFHGSISTCNPTMPSEPIYRDMASLTTYSLTPNTRKRRKRRSRRVSSPMRRMKLPPSPAKKRSRSRSRSRR